MDPCSAAEHEEPVVQGQVQSILNHGSIIQLLVVTDNGRLYSVNFDHRCFWSMVEDLGTFALKGQCVVVHGEQFVDQRVEFPDLMENEP